MCMLALPYCSFGSKEQPAGAEPPSSAESAMCTYTHTVPHGEREGSLTANLWKTSSQRTKDKGTAVQLY